jgi:hypothetical protein
MTVVVRVVVVVVVVVVCGKQRSKRGWQILGIDPQERNIPLHKWWLQQHPSEPQEHHSTRACSADGGACLAPALATISLACGLE